MMTITNPDQSDAIKIATTTQTPAAAPTIEYAKKVDNETLSKDMNKKISTDPNNYKQDSDYKKYPAADTQPSQPVAPPQMAPDPTNYKADSDYKKYPTAPAAAPAAPVAQNAQAQTAPGTMSYKQDADYVNNPTPSDIEANRVKNLAPDATKNNYNSYLNNRMEAQSLGEELKNSELSKDPEQYKLITGKLGSLMLNLGDLGSVDIGKLVRDVMQGIAKANYAWAGRDYETQLEKEFATGQSEELQMSQAEATKNVAGGTTEKVQTTLISEQNKADLAKIDRDYEQKYQQLLNEYGAYIDPKTGKYFDKKTGKELDEKTQRGLLLNVKKLEFQKDRDVSTITGQYNVTGSGLQSPNDFVSGKTIDNMGNSGLSTFGIKKAIESLITPKAGSANSNKPAAGGAIDPNSEEGKWNALLDGATVNDDSVTGAVAGRQGAQTAAGDRKPLK